MRGRVLVALVLGMGIYLACPSPANAAILTFNLGGDDYSGPHGASLPQDAIKLTFEDMGTDTSGMGTVHLTIDGHGLPVETDKMTGLAFNLDPSYGQASNLKIQFISGRPEKNSQFNPDKITGWGDAGKFDIGFEFAANNQDSFGPGDTSVFAITGFGLDVSDFLFKSIGSNPQYAVFHLNVTGTGYQSGKYGTTSVVPEPASVAMWFGFGCIGAVIAWRQRGRAR